MFRDFFLWVSEVLFYLLDGKPLLSTPWMIAWIIFWALAMTLPLWYAMNIRPSYRSMFAALAIFFPGLMMTIGPGIIQLHTLSECKSTEVVLNTDLVSNHIIEVNQCRYKDNFYGEFGEWRLLPAP